MTSKAVQNEMKRQMSANKRAAGLTVQSGWAVDRDACWLMAHVPPDTRTAAQQLMGEPMFERSALYRRTQEAGK